MNPTPTTRGRHALRWVLGAALVFVVVVGMALQVARSRADERWESVMSQLREVDGLRTPLWWPRAETRGGNVFRGWRQVHVYGLDGPGGWGGFEFALVVRHERSFFGSNMDVRMSGEAGLVDTVSAIFTELDIELVVEP